MLFSEMFIFLVTIPYLYGHYLHCFKWRKKSQKCVKCNPQKNDLDQLLLCICTVRKNVNNYCLFTNCTCVKYIYSLNSMFKCAVSCKSRLNWISVLLTSCGEGWMFALYLVLQELMFTIPLLSLKSFFNLGSHEKSFVDLKWIIYFHVSFIFVVSVNVNFVFCVFHLTYCDSNSEE